MNIQKRKDGADTDSGWKKMTDMTTMREFPHINEALQLYRLYTGKDYLFIYDKGNIDGILWVPSIQKHPCKLPKYDYDYSGRGNLNYLDFQLSNITNLDITDDREKMTQTIIYIVTTVLKTVE